MEIQGIGWVLGFFAGWFLGRLLVYRQMDALVEKSSRVLRRIAQEERR